MHGGVMLRCVVLAAVIASRWCLAVTQQALRLS
jgi:hypothetical protein